MNPEQLIQDAFVARADKDLEDRKASTGWSGKRTSWPVWAPEVAVAALKAAGWRPPACGCGPEAVSDDKAFYAAVMSDIQALDEAESTIDQAMRDIADGGEWPELPA